VSKEKKKGNREIRKPKIARPTEAATPPSFVDAARPPKGASKIGTTARK